MSSPNSSEDNVPTPISFIADTLFEGIEPQVSIVESQEKKPHPQKETEKTAVGSGGPATQAKVLPTSAVDAVPVKSYQFRQPMPAPGSYGAISFNGTDVTEFLDQFQEMVEDYGLDIEVVKKRLFRYCTPDLSPIIEMSPWLREGTWSDLCKNLKKDFAKKELKQKMQTAFT